MEVKVRKVHRACPHRVPKCLRCRLPQTVATLTSLSSCKILSICSVCRNSRTKYTVWHHIARLRSKEDCSCRYRQSLHTSLEKEKTALVMLNTPLRLMAHLGQNLQNCVRSRIVQLLPSHHPTLSTIFSFSNAQTSHKILMHKNNEVARYLDAPITIQCDALTASRRYPDAIRINRISKK
jgi:hypothetical protein